ncbi:pyruvate carboxylase [Mycolicibacterium neoaurum]|uniref:biotin carboxylase n=1 Tax=Mycolicibacterium neoaurum TaxID=1795 RepID=A0AAV2WGN3_MYCNE|nr:pyruvate carboxylase [Mycolicibacterium neoaurum]
MSRIRSGTRDIAIRAFRAATEMNIATVAVYPFEDRNSLHRLKADESYQIGDEKADKTNPDHIAAPFAGVVTIGVDTGDTVQAGQTIATIEAMKMEASITAPKAGTVARIAVTGTAQVEGGDLLVIVD